MYAIVTIAGKQWNLSPSQVIEVPLLAAEPGSTVKFDQVHLMADGGKVTLGKPFIGKAVVTAKVLEHGRGPKIIVGKFKRRKEYRKKNGHRQDFTRLEIQSITV